MNRQHKQWRYVGAASIGLLALLAACGGGGNAPDSIAVPDATVQVTGKAVDASGNGLPGVEVVYEYNDKSSSALTNGAGNFDLRLPAGQVGDIQNPAICIVKDGFEPQWLSYPTLQGGQNYTSTVTLDALPVNVSIPRNAQCLWHLGDDNFIGGLNQQLQKKSDGLVKAFAIDDWAAKVATGLYTKVTITMLAKGWQSDTCPNSVALVGSAPGAEASLPGGISADADWAQYTFEFDIARIGPTSASVLVTTGACLANDFDDFEFLQMRAEFS